MHQRGNFALILLITLLLLAGAIFFLISKGNFSNSNLGSQIFKEIQSPSGDKVGETNPFAKVNPFKGVYKNPFD